MTIEKFKSFLFLTIAFIIINKTSSCQSNGINGVYAGVELSISPMMGGGMDRTDVVILFRKDGSFTDKLKEPD